jgi:hypothetical protein
LAAERRSRSRSLDAFTGLRVYIVRNEDADMVRDLIGNALPWARRIEFAQAGGTALRRLAEAGDFSPAVKPDTTT